MTKFGETHGFRGYDFVKKLEDCLDRKVDGIICNKKRPDNKVIKRYLDEKAEFVELEKSEKWIGNRKIYDGNLLDTSTQIVRHDPTKLATLIEKILIKKNNSI